MDQLDKKILRALQENAKQHTKEIAASIGLSITPTYERIKKLEQNGIVKSYVALLDRIKIGKELIAFCQISLIKHQRDQADQFMSEIMAFPEIMECYHVSGNFDFLLKVAVNDMNQFYEFINGKLSAVDGLSTVHSSFVMHSVKESTAYPLD